MENEKLLVTLETLLKNGLSSQNSQFRLISNPYDYKAVAQFALDIRKVLLGLKRICNKATKTYLKQISHGAPDPMLLVSIRELMTCYNFYWREYATALDMTDEYTNYVLSGHLLDTLCCYERPEKDMHDSRRKE